MSIDYQFKYMPLVGKLPGKSMEEQTETAINEIAQIVNENTAQTEIINTLAEEANSNSAEALEKANEALTTSSRVYITAGQVVDLDDYCESQLIYIDKTASSHLPVASKGFLEVKTNDDKTEATQVFVDDTNKEVYTRSGAITATTVGDVTTYSATYSAWNKAASTNYVENMTLIRQNSTAYSVGDIARSTSLASYMLLECTSAGTTGASEPSFAGVSVGSVVSDGSLSWTVIQFAKTDSPAFTGNPTAPTQSVSDDSTKIATTGYVKDCVPASVGSSTIPTYTNANGVVTASNASVGDSSTPVYMDSGEIKALSDTVGDANTPVYMDGGEIKSTGKSFANYVPVGVVQAFAGSTTPTGWLLCDGSAVSRTTYADLFAVIGTTYGTGDGSTTFNLPNLVDKFVEGSATSGTVKSAGLPNITGKISNSVDTSMCLVGANANRGTGALNTSAGGKRPNVFNSDTGTYAGEITLDASRSNSIYGNSTTVQPPALTMRYIIKY